MKRFIEENRRYLELLIVTIIIILFFIAVFVRSDAVLAALDRMIGVLMPFIVGFVIAYLLQPIAKSCEELLKALIGKILKREVRSCKGAAIAVTFILMLGFITLLVYAVIPGLANSIRTLVINAPGSARQFEEWFRKMIGEGSENGMLAGLSETLNSAYEHIYQSIQSSLLPNLENLVTSVTAGFSGMVGVLKNFLLGCIVAIYMLASWEKFGAQAKIMLYGLVPEKAADWICDEMELTDKLFGGFINGKIIDSAIIGVICFVVCMLLKMPYALLVSVIVGVTNIIPFFGPYMGAVPSAILILTESPTKCIIFIIFIIILQQVDGNVIGPKILGDKIGISSFWILFSILFFGSYWGIIGMLVGVPIFGLIYDLVRRFIRNGLAEHGKSDMMDAYHRQFEPDVVEKKDEKGNGNG